MNQYVAKNAHDKLGGGEKNGGSKVGGSESTEKRRSEYLGLIDWRLCCPSSPRKDDQIKGGTIFGDARPFQKRPRSDLGSFQTP